jgi:UDP-glucose 4-epimerase
MMADLSLSQPSLKQVSLRYFNPIGAHPSGRIGEWPIGVPNNLVPFITQAAAKKRARLTIFGRDYPTPDGTCLRDYIHVCDLADAHVAALGWMRKAQAPLLDYFNIGMGRATSVKEIIDNFQAANGVEVPFEYGPRRDGDVPAIFANADKATKILGWKAKYTINDALKHAWKWEQALD